MPATYTCDECGFSGTIEQLSAHDCAAAETVVPDMIGEVIGWRAWRIHRVGRILRLHSVSHSSTIWAPNDWTRAECGDSKTTCRKSDDGRIPGDTCTCGIYAAESRRHLLSLGYNRYSDDHDVVIGEVGLVGKVVEGHQGFRAERARIVKISVPYERWKLLDPLKAQYGQWGADFVLGNNFREED